MLRLSRPLYDNLHIFTIIVGVASSMFDRYRIVMIILPQMADSTSKLEDPREQGHKLSIEVATAAHQIFYDGSTSYDYGERKQP